MLRGDEKMLLEFSCENHKSINKKVTFSFIASKDNKNEDEIIHIDKLRVLRNAVIYGANGSGKSNFISALGIMHSIVSNSINHQPGELVIQTPHKLSSKDTPSSYEIKFIKNGVRYVYGFSILNGIISDEYLFFYPKGRAVKIFERDQDKKISYGSLYSKDKKAFKNSVAALKENRLFLSCAANYSDFQEIEDAFKFLCHDIVIYNPDINNWLEYSINILQRNEKVKGIFINILKSLGIGVKDVEVGIEKKKIDNINEISFMAEGGKTSLPKEIQILRAKMQYENFETDVLNEESSGIRKMFELICPIIDILIKGKILICDEIENGLHELVAYEIIKMFNITLQDNNSAQLLFTTHNTSLLSKDLFRRDQIWFTQLDESRSTDLFSLNEIRNVRQDENYTRGYIAGKYGGIPILSNNIYSLF